jgi:ribose transport system permease protein
LVGLVNGISVGVFRVHPLIVTLGMGLVVLGFSNVWQLRMLQTGTGIPVELKTLGTGLWADIVPYSLIVFVPLAVIIILLRRPLRAMLYALGDNPVSRHRAFAHGRSAQPYAVSSARRDGRLIYAVSIRRPA